MPISRWRKMNAGVAFRAANADELHHQKVCCSYHGCVLGDADDCPVVTQQIEQAGDCEDCCLGNENRRNVLSADMPVRKRTATDKR